MGARGGEEFLGEERPSRGTIRCPWFQFWRSGPNISPLCRRDGRHKGEMFGPLRQNWNQGHRIVPRLGLSSPRNSSPPLAPILAQRPTLLPFFPTPPSTYYSP